MAILTNISGITIVTANNSVLDTPESASCVQYLRESSIKFYDTDYDAEDYPPSDNTLADILSNIGSWTFGRDENLTQYTFTNFPIITWIEHYDDGNNCANCCQTLAQLQSSIIVSNKNLII